MTTLEILTPVLGGLLTAWNGYQAKQLGGLRAQLAELTAWRTTASGYIGTLWFLCSQNGITPAPIPVELGLGFPQQQTPPDPSGPNHEEV